MAHKSSRGWHITPWELVRSRLFGGKEVDVVAFARKHGLREIGVRWVFAGIGVTLPPTLCEALAAETKMSVEFFHNLNTQYLAQVPPAPPPASSSGALYPRALFIMKMTKLRESGALSGFYIVLGRPVPLLTEAVYLVDILKTAGGGV